MKTSSESWNETPGVHNTSEKEVLEIKKMSKGREMKGVHGVL